MEDELKKALREILVGFLFGLLICSLLSLAFGCSTKKKVVDNVNVVTDTNINKAYKDSIVYIHDTTVTTQIIRETEQITVSSDETLQEWWDNWTRTWIDSMGNVVTEQHETGNKNSNTKNLTSTIRSLEDSLLLLNSRYNYYREMCDSLRDTSKQTVTTEHKEIKSNGTNWYAIFFWIMVLSAVSFSCYQIYRTIKK